MLGTEPENRAFSRDCALRTLLAARLRTSRDFRTIFQYCNSFCSSPPTIFVEETWTFWELDPNALRRS